MKKFLSLFLAIAMLVSLNACGGSKVASLDYSKNENWYMTVNAEKPVDTIFFFPTLIDNAENGDYVSVNEMRSTPLAKQSFDEQASAFTENTNLYIPCYRQAAMSAVGKCGLDLEALKKLEIENVPYADAEASLDYYFKNNNKGKPFILAGHSQGSFIVLAILENYMKKHPEYLKQMVAAYAIGFAPSKNYFEKNTHLKFATGEDDTGCVISWNTVAPGATSKRLICPDGALAINPLNWKTDDTYADAKLNEGSMIDGSFEFNYADAKVIPEKGFVECNTAYQPTDGGDILGDKSYHGVDYQLYYTSLSNNVGTRINAFSAK